VIVQEVGPFMDLGSAEFRTTEGTCAGDSGGPAIDAASGAVIGALSRGGNGKPGTGADSCLGATNIYTSTVGHADIIRQGYAKVGQQPWLEGQPNPTLGADAGATANKDEKDGCNASDGRSSNRLSSPTLLLFTVAVLFRRRKRR
jgi:hypothetical protein